MLDFAIKTAQKAGKFLVKKSKGHLTITKKGVRDLVTEADIGAEELIIKEIQKKFPDHGIIAEESSGNNKNNLKKLKKAPYIWIIDPLDGTTNYTIGLKQYAVSIGIFKNKNAESSQNFDYLEGELMIGVVYAPALDELFYAIKDGGAYLNGKRIHVSNTAKIIDATIVTGFPYRDKLATLPSFQAILAQCRDIRRFGAASLDMCYVAKGNFDAHWELGLKAWDIAGGALIIEEAGGKVTDTNGNQIDLFGGDILASNSKIHPEIVKIFSKV